MNSALASSHFASSSLEKVLEHRLLSALTTELWLRGVRDFEVLRGEVDAHGYDLVVDACNTLRHIQLKAMISGGKRRSVGVSISLARKPSGCVVWMLYDPETLELGPFLWFGGLPREPLPELGEKVARHTKGNASGLKAERAGHRLLARSRFQRLKSVPDLATALFGWVVRQGSGREAQRDQLDIIREHLVGDCAAQTPDWLNLVKAGEFRGIPAALDWDHSVELAHLIDGYRLVSEAGWGDPFRFADARLAQTTAAGQWRGGPAEVWASLFLEHRRWRMSPLSPGPEQILVLEDLCRELRTAVTR